MQALSIRQPWAWLIAMGHKDVENRTWSTRFRGAFLLHAGRRIDLAGYRWLRARTDIVLPEPESFARGGIVGRAEIADCVRSHPSPWFSGPYGFVLTNPRPLPFMPLPGQLGFFPVPEDVLRNGPDAGGQERLF